MYSVETDHLTDNDTVFQLSPLYHEKEKIIRHIKNIEIKYTSCITLRKQKIESMRRRGVIERKEEPLKNNLIKLEITNGDIKNGERETTSVDNVKLVRRRPIITHPSQHVTQPVFMPENMPVVSQQQHRQLYLLEEYYNDVSHL